MKIFIFFNRGFFIVDMAAGSYFKWTSLSKFWVDKSGFYRNGLRPAKIIHHNGLTIFYDGFDVKTTIRNPDEVKLK